MDRVAPAYGRVQSQGMHRLDLVHIDDAVTREHGEMHRFFSRAPKFH